MTMPDEDQEEYGVTPRQMADAFRQIRDIVLPLGEISPSDLALMEGTIAQAVLHTTGFPLPVQSFLAAGYLTSFIDTIDIEDPPEAIALQAIFAISMYAVELFKFYEPLDPLEGTQP